MHFRSTFASRSTHHLGSARILLAISLNVFHLTAAQAPIPVYAASQVVVQGKAMIISGGSSAAPAGSFGDISQTFALDLTVPWDTLNPKYTLFADGPGDLYVPSGLSGDGSFIVISRGQSFSFNVNSPKSWTLAGTLSNGIITKATSLTGAIDPATNMFYVPGGYRVVGANDTMMVYNVAQRTTASLPMPPTLLSYAESTTAWSSYAKRLFLHGGRSPTDYIPLGDLYSFNPADNTWSKPVPGGDTPPKRFNHCMASDATGKRLVVFGGFDNVVVPAFSDIYILNVETMQWTKGPDAGNAVARAAPSCGIDNDLFIVWGGGYNSVAVTKNVTLLFNLQTMQWVNQFVPAALQATPSGGADTSTSSSRSSTGVIIGGVAGGLALIAIVVGLFLYKRRQARSAPLNKQQGAEILYPHSFSSVPLPPAYRQQNQHYHEQRSHQQEQFPTTTNQSLRSPQFWGAKEANVPNASSESQTHSMEPIQRSAPQSHTTTRLSWIRQAKGPHAVIS
ncbi:MAG: hypothetical protein BYD32DRAFT_436731 [Podila humilis]|nr:MAG: hypothetical protein BYD32DRAFT_436731 [Podila humilis]